MLHRSRKQTLPAAGIAAFGLFLTLALHGCTPVRWPYSPGNATHELGNNYGEYQKYGGGPYYHDGIDILAPSPVPLYAVEDGTVTHVTDTGAGLYNGIMIGEPAAGGRGYLYWHIESGSLAVSVGDVVSEGDYLGDVVFWPVASFHHVHFNKVRGTGGYPWGWYDSIGNPISWLTPNSDGSNPLFQNAGTGVQFLFCENETSNYLNPNDLEGQVDVIARISDTFNAGTTWDMIPYSINLNIKPAGGGASVLNKNAFFFEGELGASSTVVNAAYKDDAVADTRGDYSARIFYFVVTNSDGDLAFENTDPANAWDTTAVPNGQYVVKVTASDRSGNDVSSSMIVTVDN